MKRFILFCILMAAASVAKVYAQNVKSVADEFMAGSETEFFCSIVGNENRSVSFDVSGRAKLLGSCYKIVTDEGLVLISDGASIWMVNNDTKEAVVTSLDDDNGDYGDLTNPFALLSSPQGNLKFSFKGTAPGGNSNIPAEIRITGFKAGQPKEIVIKIRKFSKANLNRADFVFNKKDYPGTEITDLR